MCIRDRSNAIRYAREQIDIKVSQTCELLILSVQDDGNGFLEDAQKAVSYTHLDVYKRQALRQSNVFIQLVSVTLTGFTGTGPWTFFAGILKPPSLWTVP